jgi:hypothetical protein
MTDRLQQIKTRSKRPWLRFVDNRTRLESPFAPPSLLIVISSKRKPSLYKARGRITPYEAHTKPPTNDFTHLRVTPDPTRMSRLRAHANPLPFSAISVTSSRFIATRRRSLGTIGDCFDFVILNMICHQPQVALEDLTPDTQNVTQASAIIRPRHPSIGFSVVVKSAGFVARKHRGRRKISPSG